MNTTIEDPYNLRRDRGNVYSVRRHLGRGRWLGLTWASLRRRKPAPACAARTGQLSLDLEQISGDPREPAPGSRDSASVS
ncbi:hypothetical protein SBA6_110060 [Candidatus Sulfopaludibacter sp. SbA6]|nr:hypothetical protein SBA6_110060 [Candidatus Sulfopaludibacter sp. SbA6]